MSHVGSGVVPVLSRRCRVRHRGWVVLPLVVVGVGVSVSSVSVRSLIASSTSSDAVKLSGHALGLRA